MANETRVRLSEQEARRLSELALRANGYTPQEAEIIADHVVDAALCGYEYSGLPKLLNVFDDRRFKLPRREIAVSKQTSVSALVDGGNNNAMLVLAHAARLAAGIAKEHGVGLVAVRNSWMSGRSAYFVEMLASQGLVGICTVSTPAQVAAPGGSTKVLGTNPIAFAFPTDGDPLVIDFGTAAFMRSDVQYRARMGIALPEGSALDARGQPTTDAALAMLGTLLPFGGHKGFALSLAMHAMGLLCNHPENGGHFLIAFKQELFITKEEFGQALHTHLDAIVSSPRQAGAEAIRIPGERAANERRMNRIEGVEIERRIFDELSAMARSVAA